MRLRRSLAAVMLAAAFAFMGAGCGNEEASLQPGTVIRLEAGQPGPEGPCDSWLGGGVAAAYCANGREAPAPTGDETAGQLEFTGLKRSGSTGGIAQGMAPLPEGETIGIRTRGDTTGTLLAQGLCEGMKIKAAFYDQRFADGTKGTISIQRADDVPVIVLRVDAETILPDREVVWDLSGLPVEAQHVCAFAL